MRNTSGLRRGGSPGRPPGVPNKATRDFKAFLRGVFCGAWSDPGGRQRLVADTPGSRLREPTECLEPIKEEPSLAELIARSSSAGRAVLENAEAVAAAEEQNSPWIPRKPELDASNRDNGSE